MIRLVRHDVRCWSGEAVTVTGEVTTYITRQLKPRRLILWIIATTEHDKRQAITVYATARACHPASVLVWLTQAPWPYKTTPTKEGDADLSPLSLALCLLAGGLDAGFGRRRLCASGACFAIKCGSNPLSRPPHAGSPSANERRSACACQNNSSRHSIRLSSSRGSGCQTGKASTSTRSSVARVFSHCPSSSSEPEESESKDGRLARFSPLPSLAVAAALAAACGMLLILVNIGSGGHSPSGGAAATIFASCCWQRSMSMSWLESLEDDEGGQLEEHTSWAELGMKEGARAVVVCNGTTKVGGSRNWRFLQVQPESR